MEGNSKANVGMAYCACEWRVWRLENADFRGHRLTVYRSSTGKYRAYPNGRMLGLWRTKETAMAAAEWAALAPGAHPPAPSRGKADNVVPLKAKACS